MEKKVPDRKKLFLKGVLLSVFLVFLGINLYVIVPVSGNNEAEACKRCHAMVPQYATWQVSNHSQFQCKVCHSQPGISNLIKYQTRMVKEFFLYRGADISTKITADEIPDNVCQQCHSSNRKVTASSDTIIPHDIHEDKGISCVICHKGVVHGKIMDRGITEKLDVKEWTSVVAEEQMTFRNTTPRMEVCLDCHGARRIETTCSACHSSMPVPDSHKPKSWQTNHGIDARQDFKPCNLCHVYTMREQVNLLETTLYGYIRTNDFCINCHSTKKPPDHQVPDFMPTHGAKAKTKGKENCFGCHNLNKDETQAGGWPNKINCNDCHWFKDKLF